MVAGSRKKSEHSIDWPADHLKMGFVERLQLERELRRKNKALAEAAAILVLRKKLNAYWGDDSEDN